MGIIWLYLVITLSFTEIIFFCYILIEKIQTFIFVVSLSSHRSRGPCFIAIRLSNSRQYRYHCKLLAPYEPPPARLTLGRLHERNMFRDLFHSVSCLDMLMELAHNTSADILDERRTNDLFDICHTHLCRHNRCRRNLQPLLYNHSSPRGLTLGIKISSY